MQSLGLPTTSHELLETERSPQSLVVWARHSDAVDGKHM